MQTAEAPVRALYVDDDPLLLELTTERLEGIEPRLSVTAASDPRRALERLRAGSFDCVLADHDMSALDGLSLLESVRERHPDLPLLLYTVEGADDLSRRALDAGATDCVRKAFGDGHYALLARRLVDAVAHRRAECRSDRRLAALTATREAVCLLDADRRVDHIDRGFRDLYGHDRSELVGGSWQRLHPERTVARLEEAAFPQAAATGEWTGGVTGRRADGTEFPARLTVAALPNGGFAFLAEHDGRSAGQGSRGAEPAGADD